MARFRDVMTSFTRNYIPGGPLYAAGALKFQGTEYRTGDPLPVSKMSKARHQRLFITKKADHVPPRKVSPAPTALPAATVQPGSVIPADGVTYVGDANGKRTYSIDGKPVDFVPGGYGPDETPDDDRPLPTMDECVASGQFVEVEPENGATRAIVRADSPRLSKHKRR